MVNQTHTRLIFWPHLMEYKKEMDGEWFTWTLKPTCRRKLWGIIYNPTSIGLQTFFFPLGQDWDMIRWMKCRREGERGTLSSEKNVDFKAMFPHHGINHLCYPVYQNSSYRRYAAPSNAGICSMNLDCAISVFWTQPRKLLPACLYRSQKIKKLFTIRSRLHKLFKLPNNLIWGISNLHSILFYFIFWEN